MILPFRKPVQFFLFFMLGLSSWFVVSAIFSEIPLLVQLLLEAEAVGSTLDLSVNLSNIVPLLLVLIQRKTGKSGDASIIFMSCITNVAVSFAVIFLYPSSSSSNRSSSLRLIIVTSLAGIVGNTSMVTLFPYVRPFGPAAITALSSGIGACGLVAQLLSTAQSVGHTRVAADGTAQPDPAFSLQVFFACVCGCSVLSLVCFVVIHKRMLDLRGEGSWAQGNLGIDQPAAGVAHLLRVEGHEPDGFATVSETDVADNAGDGGGDSDSATSKMVTNHDGTSGNDNGGSGDGSSSIKPSVWLRSLSLPERWVCVILACNCFMMYALPGNYSTRRTPLASVFTPLRLQVSCPSCAALPTIASPSCSGSILCTFSGRSLAARPCRFVNFIA